VKKKNFVTSKDKEDWISFTKEMGTIIPKENDEEKVNNRNKIRKLDLHGASLDEANKIVRKFVIDSFNLGYRKIIIVTGKGIRSKALNNPYISEKLSVLRHSIPEYLKRDNSLNSKIIKISKASLNDGGEGAIYIFLKKKFIK
tara:strand:+ start:422 stop:850 length:429 start_codon:yes stop_codon:yes gene_type:complete